MIRSRALRGPKLGTGALNHLGSRARQSCRKAASRGQSGQSRGGSADAPRAAGSGSAAPSVFEFVVVVIAARRRAGSLGSGSTALQELRGVAWLARLTWLPRRPLARIAPDLGLQFHDIEE